MASLGMPYSSRHPSRSIQPMPSPRTNPRGAPVALAAAWVLHVLGSVTEAQRPVREHSGRLFRWLTHRGRLVSSTGRPRGDCVCAARW